MVRVRMVLVVKKKSFGYFNLDDYGPVKLYTYANHHYHIDIRLSKGKSPRWVIFNQLTQEETETMYEALMTQWQVNE